MSRAVAGVLAVLVAACGGSSGAPGMPDAPGSGAAVCPPLPAFPDAACTGWRHTGVALRRVPEDVTSGDGWEWDPAGHVNVLTAGATLDGLDIAGAIYFQGTYDTKHGTIHLARSRVRCVGEPYWCVTLGPGSTIEDTEIGGGADGTTFGAAIGILSGDASADHAVSTITRANVHHTEHGMRVDGDTTIVDSYVHDFIMDDAGNHTDGIMITAGDRITLTHDHLSHGSTAPLFVQWQAGNTMIGNVTVADTLVEGVRTAAGNASTYGVYIEDKGISGKITVRGNQFSAHDTWAQFGGPPILIPQPIGSAVMGAVCGNTYAASHELVEIDVASPSGTAQGVACA